MNIRRPNYKEIKKYYVEVAYLFKTEYHTCKVHSICTTSSTIGLDRIKSRQPQRLGSSTV